MQKEMADKRLTPYSSGVDKYLTKVKID